MTHIMAIVQEAPRQHSQPSRKGKRAWRKNVDLGEVETGLENARDELIHGCVVPVMNPFYERVLRTV